MRRRVSPKVGVGRGLWTIRGQDLEPSAQVSPENSEGPRTGPGARIAELRGPSLVRAQQVLDAAVGDLLPAVDALGVPTQQHLCTVAAVGNLGGVQPRRSLTRRSWCRWKVAPVRQACAPDAAGSGAMRSRNYTASVASADDRHRWRQAPPRQCGLQEGKTPADANATGGAAGSWPGWPGMPDDTPGPPYGVGYHQMSTYPLAPFAAGVAGVSLAPSPPRLTPGGAGTMPLTPGLPPGRHLVQGSRRRNAGRPRPDRPTHRSDSPRSRREWARGEMRRPRRRRRWRSRVSGRRGRSRCYPTRLCRA